MAGAADLDLEAKGVDHHPAQGRLPSAYGAITSRAVTVVRKPPQEFGTEEVEGLLATLDASLEGPAVDSSRITHKISWAIPEYISPKTK